MTSLISSVSATTACCSARTSEGEERKILTMRVIYTKAAPPKTDRRQDGGRAQSRPPAYGIWHRHAERPAVIPHRGALSYSAGTTTVRIAAIAAGASAAAPLAWNGFTNLIGVPLTFVSWPDHASW